jgi:hypothetical protein
MTKFTINKEGEEYFISVKKRKKYPFTIHQRFFSENTAKEFIKKIKHKY